MEKDKEREWEAEKRKESECVCVCERLRKRDRKRENKRGMVPAGGGILGYRGQVGCWRRDLTNRMKFHYGKLSEGRREGVVSEGRPRGYLGIVLGLKVNRKGLIP